MFWGYDKIVKSIQNENDALGMCVRNQIAYSIGFFSSYEFILDCYSIDRQPSGIFAPSWLIADSLIEI